MPCHPCTSQRGVFRTEVWKSFKKYFLNLASNLVFDHGWRLIDLFIFKVLMQKKSSLTTLLKDPLSGSGSRTVLEARAYFRVHPPASCGCAEGEPGSRAGTAIVFEGFQRLRGKKV